MTADELARRVSRHLFANEGAAPSLGMEIIDVKEGFAQVGMLLRPDMLNGHHTAHGGLIFTLADTAFAYACNSRNITTVAQHAAISFLAPARSGQRLIAEARELSQSGRTAVFAVSVKTDAGNTIAEFQGLARAVGGPVIDI